MKNNPVISVITVSYNAIETIEETILSVINQTYPNIEYIIIDGGSTDGTVDIIKKYEEKITYWISEPDNGIYFAMNKGIKVASGDWIHFRNCGDYFYNQDSLKFLFRDAVNDETMILHGDCRVISIDGVNDKKPPLFYRSYKKGMPIFHPSTFVRREYHLEYSFNTKYKSSSDYEFVYMAMSRNVKMEYRPIIVSIYNALEGYSISNWKMAMREEWDWKYGSFPFKTFFLNLYLYTLDLRKFLVKLKRKIKNDN